MSLLSQSIQTLKAMTCYSVTMPGLRKQNGFALEVLNPRGELPARVIHAPARRLAELDNCKIGLYWNSKAGAEHFMDALENLLTNRYASVTILRFEGMLDVGEFSAEMLAKQVDAFVYGVGD